MFLHHFIILSNFILSLTACVERNAKFDIQLENFAVYSMSLSFNKQYVTPALNASPAPVAFATFTGIDSNIPCLFLLM